MKREIKFKAKRVDNGEWVFGSLVTGFWTKSKDGTEVVEIIESKDFAGDCWEDIMDDYVFEVHPETVCQFTGLTDKNGVDIFEGDDLKTPAGLGSVNFRGGVYWLHWNEKDSTTLYYVKSEQIEITGNIHDNE